MVAARACSTGSVKRNNGVWPPAVGVFGVVGVEDVLVAVVVGVLGVVGALTDGEEPAELSGVAYWVRLVFGLGDMR